MKWLNQRYAFGKPLKKQAALRQVIGKMIYKTESMQHYVDSVTYQMCRMNFKEQNRYLGGPICLMKTHCAREAQWISDQSVQLFGGRGLTNHGMGARIALNRGSNQYWGILGGANEPLVDFGVRQAFRAIPKWSKL